MIAFSKTNKLVVFRKTRNFWAYIKHSGPISFQNLFQVRCCKISISLCNIFSPVSKPASVELPEREWGKKKKNRKRKGDCKEHFQLLTNKH